tara:strand:+ start:110 stop:340 length:231 start_codon:yes stop_codon:yes gene_type:complete
MSYTKYDKDILRLRKKIYEKQRFLLNKVYNENICSYDDIKVKNLTGEIIILEIILESKMDTLKETRDNFYKYKDDD